MTIPEQINAFIESRYGEPITGSQMQELLKALGEYISLLTAELEETVSIAHIHHWRSHRYEQGVEIRAKITELISQQS